MVTGCIALTGITLAHQGHAYLALRRLGDMEWVDSAPPHEIREAARASLDLWFVEPHDPMIWLGRYGIPEDVPVIRAKLRRAGIEGSEPHSCTWAHAYAAIEQIEARHAGPND